MAQFQTAFFDRKKNNDLMFLSKLTVNFRYQKKNQRKGQNPQPLLAGRAKSPATERVKVDVPLFLNGSVGLWNFSRFVLASKNTWS